MAVLVEEEHRERSPGGVAVRQPDQVMDDAESVCADALWSFSGQGGGLVVADDGAIWVSDTPSGTVWRVSEDGAATAIAIASAELEHGRRGSTRLSAPTGLALSPDGSLFVADRTRHRVLAVHADGSLRVVAGGANGYRDGPGSEAMFRFPLDVTITTDGTCLVADTGNDRIRAISLDGIVSTVAGSIYDYGDGRGPHARFRHPGALDADLEGTCFVADTGNNAIRRIAPDGEVTTLAGAPPGGDNDGTARDAGFRWPTGIAAGADGSVWVADHANSALRRVSAAGETSTTFRLSGPRWPTAVALCRDGTPVVAATTRCGVHGSETCLFVLGQH